eukprot:TRINITY_DN33532_c0_g1_i1.p1 TRINITY_DN33532_c0_g1~~TRINITY_DN33532_c0_g1_i1.p1  ORF type:complete len:545 (-),score=68.11 TRINITY_DN33532_c0_g1_i1:296-1693(-)
MLASIGNIGGNVGLIGGFVFDRFGPTYISTMAGLTGLCGWLLMAASVYVPFGGAVTLLVIHFVLGQAQCWSDMIAIPTVQGYFPHNRGAVVGLAKSLVGLSPAFVAQLAVLFGINHDSTLPEFCTFFVALGIWFFLTCFVGFSITKPEPGQATVDVQTVVGPRLSSGRLAIICLALYFLLAKFVEQAFDKAFWIAAVCTVVTLAVFYLVLLFIGQSPEESCDDTLSSASLLQPSDGVSPEPLTPQNDTSMTLSQAVRTPMFWELFMILFAVMGAGLVVVNNIGLMVIARGGTDAAIFVSMLSVTNCIGRLMVGMLSDMFVSRGMPRPFVLGLSVGTVGLGHLLLACFGEGTLVLYPASCLCGFGYGGCFAMLATIPSEVFGLSHLGSIYGTYTIAVGGGSLLLATSLASSVVEANTALGETDCIGSECFSLTFLICTGLCAIASATCFVLGKQTQRFYRVSKAIV